MYACMRMGFLIFMHLDVTGQVEQSHRHASLSGAQQRRVGWLAVALGSGDVLVTPVPHPAAVLRQQQQQQQQQQRADSPVDQQQHSVLAVRLAAAVTLASARVGGSLAAALDWLPRPPHDLLLVGHWDGTTALWRLAPSASTRPDRCHAASLILCDAVVLQGAIMQTHRSCHVADLRSNCASFGCHDHHRPSAQLSARCCTLGASPGVAVPSHRRQSACLPRSPPIAAELLLHVRTNEGPVRSVVWAPAALEDGGDALAGRSVFMTAGHDGNVSIWDARCGCCSLLIWQWLGSRWHLAVEGSSYQCICMTDIHDRLPTSQEAASRICGHVREAPTMPAENAHLLLGRPVFRQGGRWGSSRSVRNSLSWLRRDIYHPVWQIHTGVAFILSADWPAPSLPTLAATDNGYLHVRHPDLLFSQTLPASQTNCCSSALVRTKCESQRLGACMSHCQQHIRCHVHLLRACGSL